MAEMTIVIIANKIVATTTMMAMIRSSAVVKINVSMVVMKLI